MLQKYEDIERDNQRLSMEEGQTIQNQNKTKNKQTNKQKNKQTKTKQRDKTLQRKRKIK